MEETGVQIRLHGNPADPVLVYLPGLHGDWTLIGSFRQAIAGRARFVELTYPRTLEWSLDEYAAGVEQALRSAGVQRGWLLAESFGSQVAWPLLARGFFQAEGLILAGGFGKHPALWGVMLTEKVLGRISMDWMVRALVGYAQVARWRFRHQPEVLAGVHEFVERRTELDRQAAVHRLRLIARNNPAGIAHQVQVPVYGLTGLLDPVVPWPWAKRWLRQNCPSLAAYQIVRSADHTVLSTGARQCATQIAEWINPQGRKNRGQQRG